MSVGKDKTGVLVNMDKELKAKLEQLAKEDCRSLTSFINKILTDYPVLSGSTERIFSKHRFI